MREGGNGEGKGRKSGNHRVYPKLGKFQNQIIKEKLHFCLSGCALDFE